MRKDFRRVAVAGFAALASLVAGSCETVTDQIPSTGGVFLVLRDSSLGSQASAVPTRQFTRWQVDGMRIVTTDPYDYSVLPIGTCSIAASASADGNPASACGGSALTLEATGSLRDVIVRLDLASMETISANRPSLPDDQDYDGDGVTNATDNCKLVWNPDQEVFGDSDPLKPGVVCAAPDGNGDPTLSDQDVDGVRDCILSSLDPCVDNCYWYPNPILPDETSQTDVNRNRIGDLCEVTSPIPFSGGARLRLECPGTVTVAAGSLGLFVVDFTSALTCDPNYGTCTLDRSKVTMRLSSEDASAARTCNVVSDPPGR